MAEFLTTSGTSYNIENIIIDAQKELYLVSPYLQLSKTLYERLKDASNRGVKIHIIYGKDELKPNERNSLAEINGMQLYYFDNLHAKCYFNEKQMVITSMNMYEFSEKTNREMGVLLSNEHDSDVFQKAVKETKSIIASSEKMFIKKEVRVFAGKVNEKNNRGYCIRCEVRIPFNPEKPFCIDCFNKWAVYENEDYTESVCHMCGEFEHTSMRKALCYSCFKSL